MYSLIRVWIGSPAREDRDPGQRRRQDDERGRQPVDPSLNWMPKIGIQSDLETEYCEPRPAGQVADEQQQRDDPRREREPERDRRVSGRRQHGHDDRPDQRQERDDRDRIGTESKIIAELPTRMQVRAGHDDQPERDAEGVVLDSPGLHAPQPAPGADREPADVVHGAVDDLAIEPPQRGRDAPADDDEQQVVELVEPPLVERRAVQERQARAGADVAHRARAGPAAAAHRGPPRRAARPGRRRSRRPSRSRGSAPPSMPNSAYGSCGSAEQLLGVMEDRLQPVVQRAVAERQAERQAEEDRRDRQQDQRDGHHRRRFVDAVPDRLRARGTRPRRSGP